MLKLNDVLDCKRVMEFQGATIEYTTGLNEVYVNAQDVLFVMQNKFNKNFGYLQSMEDLVYLLDKHNCLSKSLSCYDHVIIADYLYEKNINIDMVIKLCGKVNCDKFKSFLEFAKDVINKFGIYVPSPNMSHYDKRQNNDKNLSSTLDLSALADAAYRLGVYEDNLYLDIADAVCSIVFNNNLESMRYNLNMLYEDYLSDYISDYEYDMVAYCCRIMSYMLKYSDIGVYGMEVFTRAALDVALRSYDKSKSISKERTGSAIKNIFDKAMMNDLEYDPDVKMTKKQKVSHEDIEDFKRYL